MRLDEHYVKGWEVEAASVATMKRPRRMEFFCFDDGSW